MGDLKVEDVVLTAFVFFTVNTLDGEELVLAKLLKLSVVVLSLLPNMLPLLVPAKNKIIKFNCANNIDKEAIDQITSTYKYAYCSYKVDSPAAPHVRVIHRDHISLFTFQNGPYKTQHLIFAHLSCGLLPRK